MTARHQLRIGNRRLGRDRTPIDAVPAPPCEKRETEARRAERINDGVGIVKQLRARTMCFATRLSRRRISLAVRALPVLRLQEHLDRSRREEK